jgi:hypothetical protein
MENVFKTIAGALSKPLVDSDVDVNTGTIIKEENSTYNGSVNKGHIDTQININSLNVGNTEKKN